MIQQRLKPLLFGLPVVFGTVFSFHRLLTNYLNFEEIRDGQAVQETDYVYDFQEIEVDLPNGKPLRRTEIYLVNQKTNTHFRIPAHFSFRRTLEGLVCDSCINVIQLHGRIYFLTRAHNGGSGGYYIHSIVEITDDQAIEKGRYLSCGNVYIRNNQITFPRHESNCPEVFPDMSLNAWKYDEFDLLEH
ncbi:hypothetical protein [Egbenema bharatensis]|uniref:hypothetical protein n=1 Tax=Egbenema bharatensis TaxID=3463334 RepID=UPI003A850029